VAGIVMNTDGIDTVNLRTLGGTDNVTVGDLTGTDVNTVNVDLSGFDNTPDGAADTVTVDGTDGNDKVKLENGDDGSLVVDGLAAETHVSGGDQLDDVDVQALGGDDSLTTGVGVTGSVQATFDGGEGNDVARYVGTSGDDLIGIARTGVTTAGAFS